VELARYMYHSLLLLSPVFFVLEIAWVNLFPFSFCNDDIQLTHSLPNSCKRIGGFSIHWQKLNTT
jgi:hypothetical protein